MDRKLDYVEVHRKAYELKDRHGEQNAARYAAKLAAEALEEGEQEESEFWKAVEASFKVRSNGTN